MVLVALLACAPGPEGLLAIDEAWADGTFGVSARLHDQAAPVDGRLCTVDEPEERCAETVDARTWLEGLEGETLLRVRRREGVDTLTAIEMRQDVWLQAALYSYGDSFVAQSQPEPWDRTTHGLLDLWVMDRTDSGLLGLTGATVTPDEGRVYASDGGPLQPGAVSMGGPTWVMGLSPGEHVIQVTHPDGPCDRGVMGWPADRVDTFRVPIEAGYVTTVWIGCTPLP